MQAAYTHIFSIHSSAEGQLSWSHNLAVGNSAMMMHVCHVVSFYQHLVHPAGASSLATFLIILPWKVFETNSHSDAPNGAVTGAWNFLKGPQDIFPTVLVKIT
jgi:hypothetical protein